MRECKLPAAPGESREDVFSDAGSTPAASTTICPKSPHFEDFLAYKGMILNGFVFYNKEFRTPGSYIASRSFLIPTMFIALRILYARKARSTSAVNFSFPLQSK